ncbi:DUF262 domain-containing protein [Asaia bogorensis]|uniref:DUF262 domain-containing protein n=1 Tax=Asaia bogorensis TaxID=91915 RepID=UPI002854EA9C|nr:DUF262 domain-containing protein [Asaia bogorensis]MDR6183914.1 hypothetical protein [Asaia bogorensis NBRC 16594]
MPHSASGSSIALRSISSLLCDASGAALHYWIPAYQRGYRWTGIQVTQLLEDLWAFAQEEELSSSDSGETGTISPFYCLQPVVVRSRDNGKIEVVDGQQRLTTLLILLAHPKVDVTFLGKKPYRLTYETRDLDPSVRPDDIQANKSADAYHVRKAWDAMDEWFKSHDAAQSSRLIQHLLNEDEAGRNVRVIWYELSQADDPVEAFTRLNIGKIPLTDADLVRALFIRRATKDDPSQHLSLRIAYEWDQIEKSLQNDCFWYFLQNKVAATGARIGFILDLLTDPAASGQSGARRDVFETFSGRLSKANSAAREWERVKSDFQFLEEWFDDSETFHVIGFILQNVEHTASVLVSLLGSAKSMCKKEFLNSVQKQALAVLVGEEIVSKSRERISSIISERCHDVGYERERKGIRNILLFFNIATILSSGEDYYRFQFDKYKKESWDIEHIRPLKGGFPGQYNDQLKWLQGCQRYLGHSGDEKLRALLERVQVMIDQGKSERWAEQFEELGEELMGYLEEDRVEVSNPINGLSNLTLLDSKTNRSYKNAVFAEKRKIILEKDKRGVFIPLCTKNVFSKNYSPGLGNALIWSASDAKNYLQSVIGVIDDYFKART